MMVMSGKDTGVELISEIWHAWGSAVLGCWILWVDIVVIFEGGNLDQVHVSIRSEDHLRLNTDSCVW